MGRMAGVVFALVACLALLTAPSPAHQRVVPSGGSAAHPHTGGVLAPVLAVQSTQGLAQNTATPPAPNSVLPLPAFLQQDRSLHVQIITQQAANHALELALLEQHHRAAGADSLLPESLRYTDPFFYRQENEALLNINSSPASPFVWQALAEQTLSQGDYTTALTATWQMYHLVSQKPQTTTPAEAEAASSSAQTPTKNAEDAADLRAYTQAAALTLASRTLEALEQIEEALAASRLADQIYPSRNTRTSVQRIEARLSLRLTDFSTNTPVASNRSGNADSTDSSACFTFSQPLDIQAPHTIEDYVRLPAGRDIAVRLSGRSVCLTGFHFGETATATFLKGLPAKGGDQLSADVSHTFTLPHRTPSILFSGNNYVLPKSDSSTVPVTTVNHTSLRLTLLRVPDRGLAGWLKSGLFGKNLYPYQADITANDTGEQVWQGVLDIDSTPDTEVTTLIPLADIIAATKPGIYALTAAPQNESDDDNTRWQAQQTQWLLISDLGVTSLEGGDGLHVFVNSLATTKARGGVRARLVAKNGSVLADTLTDAAGRTHFPAAIVRGEGGNSPSLIALSTPEGDYNFIQLAGPALEIEASSAAGRTANTPLDAFLYTDRGIYRPGESVHLTGLLRDDTASAVANLPLTLIVRRPDYVVAKRIRLTGSQVGQYALDYTLSNAALTGKWQMSLHSDSETDSLGTASFEVADFVPERLKATLSASTAAVRVGKPTTFDVQADFLYGAPAAKLTGGLTATLLRETTPFDAWAGYQFGRENEAYTPVKLAERAFTTDAAGHAQVTIAPERLPKTSFPLKAHIVADIQDVGGRSIQRGQYLSVASPNLLIGLKPAVQGPFEDKAAASINIVTVNNDGTPQGARKLKLVWVREDYNYVWYQSGGTWRTRYNRYDDIIAQDALTTAAIDPNDIRTAVTAAARTLPTGSYRLEVTDAGPAASPGTDLNASATSAAHAATSSISFTVGWWSAGTDSNTPDRLSVQLEDAAISTGGTVRGFIKAPFAGTALISVVGQRFLAHKSIKLGKDGASFSFKTQANWGPSAHVLVTALRPDAAGVSRLPVRAAGTAWFSMGRSTRTHTLTLDLPDVIEPESQITIPVSLSGVRPHGVMDVTLTAVDTGILSLTAYQAPDPVDYYFGPRKLGYDMRDIYGRLIRSQDGAAGRVRSGGDAASTNANTFSNNAQTRKTVAIIKRDITLDADGKALVTLDVPDFVGQLTFTAVAASQSDLAAGSATARVRRPITADLLLPRFLAPGDTATATLSLQNLSGSAQQLSLTLTSGHSGNHARQVDPVPVGLENSEKIFPEKIDYSTTALDGDYAGDHDFEPYLKAEAEVQHYTLQLADGERRDIALPLVAQGAGEAKFTIDGTSQPVSAGLDEAARIEEGTQARSDGSLEFTAPKQGPIPIHRTFEMSVRHAWARESRTAKITILPGQSKDFAGVPEDGFIPSGLLNHVLISNTPVFDIQAPILELAKYPYQCSEQTVSAAVPYLFAQELESGYYTSPGNASEVEIKINTAVQRLIDRQRSNGSFGLWGTDSQPEPWLDAYVTDFLTRAHDKGFPVPAFTLENAVANLTRIADPRLSASARFEDTSIRFGADTSTGYSPLARYTGDMNRTDKSAAAYALYVLARYKKVSAAQVRYFADEDAAQLTSQMALAHTAAALAHVGEQEAAIRFFARAQKAKRPSDLYADYGSRVRDMAGFIALLQETGLAGEHTHKLAESLEDLYNPDARYSTQELAWLVRAGAAFSLQDKAQSGTAAGLNFTLNTTPFPDTANYVSSYSDSKPRKVLDADYQLESSDVNRAYGLMQYMSSGKPVAIANEGSLPLFVTQTLRGTPVKAPEASRYGFSIHRSFYTLDGQPIDGTKVQTLPQSTQVVVEISGTITSDAVSAPLVVDLLPAGLEIVSTDTQNLSFLAERSQTEFTKALDDRFVAALRLPHRSEGLWGQDAQQGQEAKGTAFRLAYIARAVTPGHYTVPAPYVEDMYRLRYHAVGALSQLTVTAPNTVSTSNSGSTPQ